MEQTKELSKEMIEQLTQDLLNGELYREDEPGCWIEQFPEEAAALMEMAGVLGDVLRANLTNYLNRTGRSRIDFKSAMGDEMAFGHQTTGEPELWTAKEVNLNQ